MRPDKSSALALALGFTLGLLDFALPFDLDRPVAVAFCIEDAGTVKLP